MACTLIITTNIFIQLGTIIMMVIGTIAIIKNLAVWNEIFGIEQERMAQYEYEERNKHNN